MIINITQEVIDRSKAKVEKWKEEVELARINPNYFPKIHYSSICVIAEGFKDLGFKKVKVMGAVFADNRQFYLTEKAKALIERFDEELPIKPTKLRLKEVK